MTLRRAAAAIHRVVLHAAIHRVVLRAYPLSFRTRVGDDLHDTFLRRVAAARRRGFLRGALSLAAGLADTFASGFAERAGDRRVRARDAAVSTPVRSLPMTWESIVSDVSLSLRHIRRAPLFAAMTVATLAVGIGANSAIFSAVYAALLRPLPYASADGLVAIWSHQTKLADENYPVSPANYDAFKRETSTFGQVEAMYSFLVNLQVGSADAIETIQVSTVTPGMFQLLGRQAFLGRGLQDGDEQAVVLSYAFWMRRFGGERSVIGTKLPRAGGPPPLTIVGVMPEDFIFPYRSMLGPSGFSRAQSADAWCLLSAVTESRVVDSTGQPNRTLHFFSVIARLKDGVSIERGRAELDAVAARRANDWPDSNAGFGVIVRPLLDQTVGKVRPALVLLTIGVGVLLLLTCTNITNVLLARASGQRKDLAVRAALGASRGRLLQLTLIESSVLALMGGAAALLIAAAGSQALLAIAPADLPRVTEARMSLSVIAFTLGLSLVVGLVTGLLPAVSSARTRPESGIRDSRRNTASAGQRLLRSALVVAEVTLATFLTIGAGLLLRSFSAVLGVDPGFAADHLLTFQVGVPARHVSVPGQLGFYDELRDKLMALPGVTHVGGSTRIPLGSTLVSTQLSVEGRDVAPADLPEVQMRRSVHDFFGTMRIPVEQGRVFTDADRTAGEGLVVVNRALATHVFPDEAVIGRRVRMGANPTGTWLRIIGVVGNVRHSSLEEAPKPEIYISHLQGPPSGPFMAVRTTGDPAALTSAVRATVAALGATPPANVRTMEELRSESVGARRFVLWLVGAFGVVALLLAGGGVYGVIALVVSERTAEVGVRLALGATPEQVWSLLVSQAAVLGTLGVTLGAGAAWVLTPLASALLFGISPSDPLTFGGVSILILVIAILAAALPARRAMKVDPATALRAS